MSAPEFTSEQLYKQAQGNVIAFITSTIAFFKEQHRPIEEWVTYIGSKYAPGWEEVKGKGAEAALEAAVMNFVASGGTIDSYAGDEAKAEAILIDWPPSDFLELCGLTLEDFDPFYKIYQPIATYLDLKYTWHREGNKVTFTFMR